MPAIRQEAKVKTVTYASLAEKAKEVKDDKMCAVIALAAITGLDYELAHAALAFEGRDTGNSTHVIQIENALAKLGFEVKTRDRFDFIRSYHGFHAEVLKNVTTHHPERFPAVWKDGKKYLFFTKNHVAAVVDGVNHDWTKGEAKRVQTIWEVTAVQTPEPEVAPKAPQKRATRNRSKKSTETV